MKSGIVAIVSGLAMIIASIAWAEVPNMINNQGRLTTPAGVPLFNDPTNTTDGQIDLVFSIYDAPTNGTALWGQTNANVTVHNGLFSVLLGNFGTNVFPAAGQVARWLEVTVITNGVASTLSPRKEIVSVAYALRAGDAATWGGLPAAELISLQTNVAGLQTDLGNIWSNAVYIQGSVAGIETNVAGIQTNLAILQSNLQVNVSNLLGVVGYVVGQTGREPYASMQAAINAAVADGFGQLRPVTIEVKPGRYTENLSLKAGIHLKAEIEDGLFSSVVVGNHQYDYNGADPGDLIISGVAFYSPGVTDTNPLFRIAGGSYAALRLNHCVLQSTDNGPALRQENTGVRDGRLSNVEMYHCRVRSLLPTFAGSAVELRNGSLLMDEADIYLTNPRARSFLASGASQLLLDNATIRGWIETKDNVYLQLTQSSIDSGDQACLVQNSAVAAVMLEDMLVTTLPGVVVLGSGPVLYSQVGFFYSVYGIQQKLHTNPHALPITGVNAANVGYAANATAHANWEAVFGAPGPIRVNVALDLLANGAARWIDEEVDPVFTAEGFYRDGSVPATGDFDMDGNEIWDADRIQVNDGAAAGRVLTSDADGFGTWAPLTPPPFEEHDPQVDDYMGQFTVPRWRGTNLTGGSITNLDNGNVGIGTPSPIRTLDVNGNAIIRGSLDMNGDEVTNANRIQVLSGRGEGRVLTSDTNGFGTWQALPAPIFEEHDPQVYDYMDQTVVSRWRGTNLTNSSIFSLDNGRVGIGTTNPAATLDVNSNAVMTAGLSLRQAGFDPVNNNMSADITHDGTELLFRMGGAGGRVPINFSMQDDSALFIDGNRNIGIGLRPNVQPAGRLDVRSPSDFYLLALAVGTASNTYLRAGDLTNGRVIIGDNQTTQTLIQPSFGGAVGIGTYNPTARLHIRQSGNDRDNGLYIQRRSSDYGAVMYMDPDGGVRIGTKSDSGTDYDADYIYLATGSGNVGIGTMPSPGAKLEVAGQIKITGGAPGEGKVLTSDSAGLGTWRDPGVATGETDPQVGANTLNYVPRWDGDELVKGRIYDPDTGNIGIGTESPGARLDIGGPAGASLYSTLAIKQSGPGQKGIWLQSYENNNSLSLSHNGSVGFIGTDSTGSGNAATPLALQMAGGYVGIGTPAPAYKLDVDGTIQVRNGNQLRVRESGGQSGEATLQYVGSGASAYAKLEAGDYYTYRPLALAPNGGNVGVGTATPSPNAKLDVNGNAAVRGWLYALNQVNIGGGSYPPNPLYMLDVNGHAVTRGIHYLAYSDNRIEAVWGDHHPFLAFTAPDNYTVLKPGPTGFRVTNYRNTPPNNLVLTDNGRLFLPAGEVFAGSDSRLKLNQEPLDYGLDEVLALRPKRYIRADSVTEAKTVAEKNGVEESEEQIGLVAQEVYEVIPEAVGKLELEGNEQWCLSYSRITAVLVKAVQEQQEQIELLKQRIETLEKR